MFADCFYPRINGVGVSILSFATQLVKMNHHVSIVCPNYKLPRKWFDKQTLHHYIEQLVIGEGKSIEIYRMAANKIIWSQEDRLARITQWHSLKDYLDKLKPDIIHVHTEYLVGRFGSHYAFHRKIPMIYTFHTYWENYIKNYAVTAPKIISRAFGKNISMYFFKRATKIIVPTERFANVVTSYGFKENIEVIPTGISDEVKKIDKKNFALFFNHIHKLFPIIQKKHILLYVGRIAAEKNLYFLLDVLGEVRKTVKDAVLIFVGDGPELKSLKAAANKLSYRWNICFAGYRERNELGYFYNLADVFVFPSVTESQGLVTIEAMCSGLPVVAIGEMGTADVMQGDHGGFMVPNNLEIFSQKVIDLLTDSELHKQKSEEAKEWSKQWSIESTTQKLISIYESALISCGRAFSK